MASTSRATLPARPAGELAERLRRIRYVLTDADNTMITGSCALRDSSGRPSFELAKTLVELKEAGVSVIPCTGRNRAMIREDVRILGLPGWIGELGGILCTDESPQGHWEYYTADMAYDPTCGRTPHDVICDTGVIDAMLERWRGQVELYNDNGRGYQYREVTIAMRGRMDEAEARRMMDESGLALYLGDNGYVKRITGETTLDCDPVHPVDVHDYHVAPAGLTKGAGIRKYVELLGVSPDEVLGAGDSPADLEMAGAVGTFLFMCNGLGHPKSKAALAKHDNVFVSELPSTDGWVAAMRALLSCKM